jgi:hypothetical protein
MTRTAALLATMLLAAYSGGGKGQPAMTNKPDCATSLAALGAGRVRDYPGIDRCTRADAERAFGPTALGPDAVGGLLGPHRAYPATPGAPHGLTVFFDGDQVTAIQILEPVLAEALDQALGAPEATAPSKLEPFHEQLIYARRGLTGHADKSSDKLQWLFAYRSMAVPDYPASPLAKLEIRDEISE